MSQAPTPNTLDILVEKRPALLLAEVGAWLHMLGKYYEGFLAGGQAGLQYATQLPPDLQDGASKLGQLLRGTWAGDIWEQIGIAALQAKGLSINDLITGHHNRNAPTGFVRLMNDAHGRGSGIEKGALERFAPGQTGSIYAATAMGLEVDAIDSSQLQARREMLYDFLIQSLTRMQTADSAAWPGLRQEFVNRVRQDFQTSLADSRRPFNDITLYDQTFASVAMLKAALAQILLRGWQVPNVPDVRQKYQWRILSTRLDGPAYWGQADGINDLLSRKGLVDALLDQVRDLLEQELPLGMEVYRDEHGSLFIVPEIANLLDYTFAGERLGAKLQSLAEEALKGEAFFTLTLSEPTRSMRTFGSQAAAKLPPPAPRLSQVEGWWDGASTAQNRQVCSVCGLRPQGPTPKSIDRGVCDVCEQRRTDRSSKWARSLNAGTIWMNEVADQNGRLGLLVGKFDLQPWLSGEAFSSILLLNPLADGVNQHNWSFQELLQQAETALKTPDQPLASTSDLLAGLLPKGWHAGLTSVADFYDFYVNDSDMYQGAGQPRQAWRFALALLRLQPSFARLRRTWETTWRFWKEVEQSLGSVVGQAGPRLEIRGAGAPLARLGDFHAYELVLESGLRLNVVWDRPRERFITADNLARAAELLGRQENEPALAAVMRRISGSLPIEEPSGYGTPGRTLGTLENAGAEAIGDSEYPPVVPILTEPGTFMALVPAQAALAVVDEIRQKYAREMGKIANRLPLRLGLVCAPQHTPLRAILDAGWRMLDRKPLSQTGWQVGSEQITLPEYLAGQPGFAQNRPLVLERNGRQVAWHAPLTRGDGSTFDAWYPYTAVQQPADGHPLEQRVRWFQGKQPFVHARDAQPGDLVSFAPSTFDFEWLDSSARRFEIAYAAEGDRRGILHRPYLFNELETLEKIWRVLRQGLSKSQIYALRDVIEERHESWQPGVPDLQPGGAFWQFCRDAIHNADWGEARPEHLDTWADYAVRGWLADAVELHLHILKENTTPEEEDSHA